MPKALDPGLVEEIGKLYSSGLSIVEIARRLVVDKGTAREWLRKRGIYTEPVRLTPEEKVRHRRLQQKHYYEQHRNSRAAYAKEYRKNNAVKLRMYFQKLGQTPERKKYLRLTTARRLYGLTPREYEDRLKAQNFCCALCGRPLSQGNRWGLDHNHKTGKIRGFVHLRCNRFISLVELYPEMLRGVFRYLGLEKKNVA